MQNMKKIFVFTCCFLLLSTPSFSAEKEDLKKIEREISEHKKKSSELEKKVKEANKDLKRIQKKSIEITSKLKENKEEIDSIHNRLNDLSASVSIKEMDLGKNKKQASAILSSLIRISSVPADGIIVASNNPEEIINTRILLNSALPYLREKAEKLSEDIKYIEDSKTEIADKEVKLASLTEEIKSDLKEIKSLISKKEKMKSKLTAEQKKEKKELASLAKQASSIRDFIQKLQSRKVKTKPSFKPDHKIVQSKTVPNNTKNMKSNSLLPVSGKIILGFGQKNNMNVTNKGWEIKGNNEGLVTCPIDGEVLYSGEFGSYDNLVVFDNGNGYNIVLAGMGKVGVDVGDKVKAGEPVGFLKSKDLYLEVRKDGNPINPAKVIR